MKSSTVTAIAVAGAVLTLGVAGAAVHAETTGEGAQVPHTLADLSTRHASLEDVFVTLTGRHLRDGEATP